MPRLELFAFRYCDPRTGKWRARYLAERREIEQRYAEFQITGPAEIRNVNPDARAFTPHKPPPIADPIGNLGPVLTIVGWRPSRRVAIVGVAA